jgi:hypothetical protein
METWLFMFSVAAPFVCVLGGLLWLATSSMFTGRRRRGRTSPPIES